MKKKSWFLAIAAVLAIGLVFIGCPTGDDGNDEKDTVAKPPKDSANYLTEAVILAGTGNGGTTKVAKDGSGYKVTGTVTQFQPWSENGDAPFVYRIELNIGDTITGGLKGANWYTITYDFPKDSEVKPYDKYTDGFSVYLENTSTWAGTWKHEYPEEYNKAKGQGKVAISRDLALPEESNEVGEYHHLVTVLKFPPEAVGKTYSFKISNVGVWYTPAAAINPNEGGAEATLTNVKFTVTAVPD